VAVDPYHVGESNPGGKGQIFPLLVAAVGDRPVGLQASQLAAVARWLNRDRDAGPVTLVAAGPRTSTSALVAAALEQTAIRQVELHDALGSLKEIIERSLTVNTSPELFCFGLLEQFDVKHLVALIAPRPVTLENSTDRMKQELADLGRWYGLLGSTFRPVR